MPKINFDAKGYHYEPYKFIMNKITTLFQNNVRTHQITIYHFLQNLFVPILKILVPTIMHYGATTMPI